MLESMAPILGLSISQRKEIGLEEDSEDEGPSTTFEQEIEKESSIGMSFLNFLYWEEESGDEG